MDTSKVPTFDGTKFFQWKHDFQVFLQGKSADEALTELEPNVERYQGLPYTPKETREYTEQETRR